MSREAKYAAYTGLNALDVLLFPPSVKLHTPILYPFRSKKQAASNRRIVEPVSREHACEPVYRM